MKTGILFDLDGTLLNTLEDLADSVNYTLRKFGCPERSLSEIRSFVGNGAKRLVELSLPGTENDPDLEVALAAFKSYYGDHAQIKTCPYDGIPELLTELRRTYPVAIVSNKPDAAVKLLCKDYFGDVYALGEAAGCPRKPAPDMLYNAMAAIGVEKGIYVGDSDVDVITAGNAGLPCLSVLWGFQNREQIEKAGGSRFCDDPALLIESIEEMITDGK